MRVLSIWLCWAAIAVGQDSQVESQPESQSEATSAYDPLRVRGDGDTENLLLTIREQARDRELPVRVCLPAATGPAPVVLFSHGLGGTRDTCAYLGAHWSRRGYAVVFVQHPGSDDSVWQDEPRHRRMAKMQAAASGRNLVARCQDVAATLDQLAVWNADPEHPCGGRLDLQRIGMSGHSFGAMTTQFVSGQSAPLVGQRWLDRRIDAAISMSPSAPVRGDLTAAFAKVEVPWLCMTGTEDGALIGEQTPASRRLVYPNLPTTIARYELVLHGAEHRAFTERALPGDSRPRNDNHHRVILAVSTAFWDAHLAGDDAARLWLAGGGPLGVMQDADSWQAGGGG